MSNDKAQELTKTINDSIATLCAETDAAKQSATYKAWLNTVSRFYRYSFGNQILIWCQSPDATRVAGFHTLSQERRTRHPHPCADHSQGGTGAQRQDRGSD
jgi:hypothetical protein